MTVAVFDALDVTVAARAIARVADTDSKRTGRPCRLQDALAVQAFLTALVNGSSLYAASVSAGFSEGAVRLWLKLGASAGASGVYADLARAVAASRAAREKPVEQPAVPAVVQASRPVSAAAVPKAPAAPVIPTVQIHYWMGLRNRIEALCSQADSGEGRDLRRQLDSDMRAFGVSPSTMVLPRQWPCLNLPRGLAHDEKMRLYLQWRQTTGQSGPTDAELELNAPRWYVAHRKPE